MSAPPAATEDIKADGQARGSQSGSASLAFGGGGSGQLQQNPFSQPGQYASQQQGQQQGSGGQSGANAQRRPRQAISYAAERVIGNGSFGVVYQATVLESQETVAIKKVLQDKRFKNRELMIMSSLNHPNVVALKHCFYSRGERHDDVFLNLVMEYIPETIYRTLRNHTKAKKLVPILHTKSYIYQVCRALAYIHSLGICHRDIKPQNLLLNARTHDVKLCDFGSAKPLLKGEPNVAYICSRYYRAPELVFEATDYTTAIDIWSLGCVLAELLLGTPLFPGDSSLEQLIEIIKIMGTPSREEIHAMNPNHTRFRFPQIQTRPWNSVFRNKAPMTAVDLVGQFLRYIPTSRLLPFDALAHPFFDELREPGVRLPNGRAPPNLHNWTDAEIQLMHQRGLFNKLIPPHIQAQMVDGRMPAVIIDEPVGSMGAGAAAAGTGMGPASPTAMGSAATSPLPVNVNPHATAGASATGYSQAPSGAGGAVYGQAPQQMANGNAGGAFNFGR